MRGAGLALIGVFGSLAAFIFSAVMGANAGSWFVFLFMLVISGGGVYVLYKWVWGLGRISMDEWISSLAGCPYKAAWDGSGIAVDTEKKQIHLASKFKDKMATKAYPFSAIREWEYNIEGRTVHQADQIHLMGGHGLTTHLQAASHNVGNALGAGVANIASAVAAEEKTGMTLTVADIDYPKWFVKFKPQKNLEMELSRWMEILRQHINEGA